MFRDKAVETIPRDDLEKLQIKRLKASIRQALKTPFYKNLYRKLKIGPDSIKKLGDLRELPFTVKQNLRDGFPYGFLAVKLSQCIRLHVSSGTTGQATVIFHTAGDIDRWAEMGARCLAMTGLKPGDVFQNMMGYGLFTGGLGLHYAAERLGVLTIPASSGNSMRQIRLMRDFGTTAIHIVPSYAMHLVDNFAEMGLDPRKDTKLRIAYIGAEPHSEETRGKIQDMYGLKAFNSYGLTEMNGPGVAFECPRQRGMHLWEDFYILEVIDPETTEPVADGQEGELVFTTLTREAVPLIRYRTRDLAYVYPEPCRCGRTHRRISRIKGRSDDMMIIKGVNVFPSQVEQVLMAMPEVGATYVIELDRENHNDKMTVKVEVNKKLFTGKLEKLNELKRALSHRLRDEILITPQVELVEPGTLPRAEGKAIRVVDRRKDKI